MFQQRSKSYAQFHWKRNHSHQKERDAKAEGSGIDIYKFKLKMANTLSVMTNVLRNVVSKKRIRYKEKGFNLDLAYINDNIIAMGYPAESIESIYRNRMEDVYNFLEKNHQEHYKIYNLCIERNYDINKFHGRVAVYPFEDHNPPTIELIQKFCEDVDNWLKADSRNVAAVHCKAGKGRTGTMICCYLMYSGQQSTAEDALACYDEKRTKNRKGVTIPSQRRYVQYFAMLKQLRVPYERKILQLCEIRFIDANLLQTHGSVLCSISVLQDHSSAAKVMLLQSFLIDFRKAFILKIKNPPLSVDGDIKIELTHKTKKFFHFWFNTFFVACRYDAVTLEGHGDDAKLVYTLHKSEIDDAHKDKDHKCFSENFKVQLVFYADCCSVESFQKVISGHTNNRSTTNNQTISIFQPTSASYNDLVNDLCNQKSANSICIRSLDRCATDREENRDLNTKKLNKNFPSSNSVPVMTHDFSIHDTNARFKASPAFPGLQQSSYPEIDLDLVHQQHATEDNIATPNTQLFKYNQLIQKAPMVAETTAEVVQAYLDSQQQQHVQPSDSISNVGIKNSSNDTTKRKINAKTQCVLDLPPNTCNIISTNNHNHANNINHNNTSSSSDISSSSQSTTGDNEEEEEDWESGECFAKPQSVHNALPFSSPNMPQFPSSANFTPALNPHATFNLSSYSNNSSCNNRIGGDNYSNCNDSDLVVDDDDKLPNISSNRDLKAAEVSTFSSLDNNLPVPAVKKQQQSRQQSVTLLTATTTVTLAATDRYKFARIFRASNNAAHATRKSIFKRKSFKKAKPNCATSVIQVDEAVPTTSSGLPGGLSCTAKQNLKINLKKNKFKLYKKFQWFQSYFRADPDNFRENFIQQTTDMTRNSNCNVASLSKKLFTNTSPTSYAVANVKLSCSPSTLCIASKLKPERFQTKSLSCGSISASNFGRSFNGDNYEDFYSSICDNQLSFNNSPCKSPRSLVDLVSIDTNHNYGRNVYMNRLASQQIKVNENQQMPSLNIENTETVIVAARPAKLNAIGFKVANKVTPSGVSTESIIEGHCNKGIDSWPASGTKNTQKSDSISLTPRIKFNATIEQKPSPFNFASMSKEIEWINDSQNDSAKSYNFLNYFEGSPYNSYSNKTNNGSLGVSPDGVSLNKATNCIKSSGKNLIASSTASYSNKKKKNYDTCNSDCCPNSSNNNFCSDVQLDVRSAAEEQLEFLPLPNDKHSMIPLNTEKNTQVVASVAQISKSEK